jgi:hypothetical protein
VVRAANAREISPVVLNKMSSLNVTGQEMQQLSQLREFGFAQGIKFHFLKLFTLQNTASSQNMLKPHRASEERRERTQNL